MEKYFDKISEVIREECKKTKQIVRQENEATRVFVGEKFEEMKEMFKSLQANAHMDVDDDVGDDDVGDNVIVAGNQNENFEILGTLGGGIGVMVWKVLKPSSNEIFAMKDIYSTVITKDMIREIYLLKEAEHDNIVRLVEVYINVGSVSLVMDYHPNTLKNIIDRKENSEADNKIWLKHLLHGLSYLHGKGIVHRDIKPDNLLITEDNILKIGDFGSARGFLDGNLTAKVGTLPYRAPENLLGAPTGKPVDIWAVGCILFEMTEGKILFGMANSDDKVISDIHRMLEMLKEQSVTPKLNDEGHDLLRKLLDIDPNTRITADEALNHPFMFDSE